MARFRHNKTYFNSNNNDSVDSWENNYSGLQLNRIPNKTIIRTVVNFFKYGKLSKGIFI